MPLPNEISPARAVVLMALLRVHTRDGRATIRGVAAEANKSLSATYRTLNVLRRDGFCDWDNDHKGTLHPTVTAVPVG